MNLVIGTRHWLGPDWHHVDGDASPIIDENGHLHAVDTVCGADRIPLPDASFDHLFSTECLEHFDRASADRVLVEWVRLVCPGGTVRIEVPDFLAACKQVIEADTLEMDLAIMPIFYGGQINKWDFHYNGFTHRSLPDALNRAGVDVIDVKRGWEVGWLRCDGVKR